MEPPQHSSPASHSCRGLCLHLFSLLPAHQAEWARTAGDSGQNRTSWNKNQGPAGSELDAMQIIQFLLVCLSQRSSCCVPGRWWTGKDWNSVPLYPESFTWPFLLSVSWFAAVFQSKFFFLDIWCLFFTSKSFSVSLSPCVSTSRSLHPLV